MDAGFVDDLGRSLKARSGIFPVFFPVIPKIAFGDEFESDCVISQPVPSLGPCPARKNLCDVPARDGGESLWRIFLVFRWGSSNFVRQSLVANFQYPCSDLRGWVRTRMRGSDTRFRFSQAAAGTAAVGKAVRRNVRPPERFEAPQPAGQDHDLLVLAGAKRAPVFTTGRNGSRQEKTEEMEA